MKEFRYEEWKRKNKRELPIVGEREGVNTSNMDRWKYKHKGGQSGKGEDPLREIV